MNAAPAVVVVGSLHHDLVVDAPDRPRKGETVTGRSLSRKCGGKGGNQAVAASRHGAATAFVGAVGDDASGEALLNGLRRAGVDTERVAIVPETASGISIAIFDDEGDYGAVIVSGANLLIDAERLDETLFAANRVLVLQNEIPEAINERAATRARQRGMTVLLNAAPARPFTTRLADLVDLLVVNALEAEMLGGGRVNDLHDAVLAAASLGGQFGAAIVTAGGDGVAYADRHGQRHARSALPVALQSTHGAGDSFVGTLASCLSGGMGIESALEAANRAAARLVATPEAERKDW